VRGWGKAVGEDGEVMNCKAFAEAGKGTSQFEENQLL